MSNLQSVYDKAVAKLGQSNVDSMLYCCGATKPELDDVPAHRRDQLQNVLGRMIGSGAALAQASADFETINAAGRKEAKPKPTLDPVAIFKRWNASTSAIG